MLNRRFHPGHLLLICLGILCGFLALQVLSALNSPLPDAPHISQPALADRALLARFDPFFPAKGSDSAALPVTALPLSLHGVRNDTATGQGAAIIAVGNDEQKLFQVGDTISNGVTLAAIASDHVILDRSGTREALWLDNSSEAPVQNFDVPASSASPSSPPADAAASDAPDITPAEPSADTPPAGAAMVAAAPPRQD